MSSNRRWIVQEYQVELSVCLWVCESMNLWNLEVLTHLIFSFFNFFFWGGGAQHKNFVGDGPKKLMGEGVKKQKESVSERGVHINDKWRGVPEGGTQICHPLSLIWFYLIHFCRYNKGGHDDRGDVKNSPKKDDIIYVQPLTIKTIDESWKIKIQNIIMNIM